MSQFRLERIPIKIIGIKNLERVNKLKQINFLKTLVEKLEKLFYNCEVTSYTELLGQETVKLINILEVRYLSSLAIQSFVTLLESYIILGIVDSYSFDFEHETIIIFLPREEKEEKLNGGE